MYIYNLVFFVFTAAALVAENKELGNKIYKLEKDVAVFRGKFDVVKFFLRDIARLKLHSETRHAETQTNPEVRHFNYFYNCFGYFFKTCLYIVRVNDCSICRLFLVITEYCNILYTSFKCIGV